MYTPVSSSYAIRQKWRKADKSTQNRPVFENFKKKRQKTSANFSKAVV